MAQDKGLIPAMAIEGTGQRVDTTHGTGERADTSHGTGERDDTSHGTRGYWTKG